MAKPKMNDMASIGKYLLEEKDSISYCTSKENLINTIRNILEKHLDDDIVKRDYEAFMNDLKKKYTFYDAWHYVYNYILAGEGLRVI